MCFVDLEKAFDRIPKKVGNEEKILTRDDSQSGDEFL